VSEYQPVNQSRRLGRDSDLCPQASAIESSARTQQSLVPAAAAETGRLQSRRSRGGRTRGRRSLEQAKTCVNHKDGDTKKRTGGDQGEASPVVTVKRGRGRPRKVCITSARYYSTSHI